jgi:hypothetical protein
MFNIPEVEKNKLLSNVPVNYHTDIIFTNFVPDNDYKYLLKNAEFTIFISLYEGFGYSIMESIYLGTPVLTSDNSSMKELGNLSPNEILLCNPLDIDDIVNKMNYLSENLHNYDCKNKILFNKCYNINNKSLINQINQINDINQFICNLYNIQQNNNISIIYQRYINNCINKDKVKNYNINLEDNLYKLILNLFDINVQLRISNGGGGSGCVTDTCFLNKYLITTDDLHKNAIPKNYKDVIIGNINFSDDWKPIMTGIDFGGYSEIDIDNIVNKIIKDISNIKSYKYGINNKLSNRLYEYPNKLIRILNLTASSRICFVTPYGNDLSGISDFSYTTINELSFYINKIDIYTDCNEIEMEKQQKNISFYKIDEIINNKDNYDEIIWVVGNSHFHTKIIIYSMNLGGTFIIHDESLYELYCHNKWVPNSLEKIHPFKLREMGDKINYEYLCFHDITNNPNNKFIVHNDNLKNILKKNYNINKINLIKYPNFNLNIFDKLTKKETEYYKEILNINDKKLNILIVGGASDLKLINYSFKILDKLIDKGIDSELYLFYNK